MSENKKGNKKRLFSKALFKQSCKANGTMWLIITVAVCFMLACVMLISGTSSVSSVKEGIQDTIIEKTIESSVKKSSVDLYQTTDDAEYIFDKAFAEKIAELNTKANYNKVSTVTTAATDEATQLVADYVTPLVEAEVEDRLTPKATAYVTEKATAAVTEQITKEVTAEVTNHTGDIIGSAFQTEATNKILAKLAAGETSANAINEVITEYQTSYTQYFAANLQANVTSQGQEEGTVAYQAAMASCNAKETEEEKRACQVEVGDATAYVTNYTTQYVTEKGSEYVAQQLLTNVFTSDASSQIQTSYASNGDLSSSINTVVNKLTSDATSYYTTLATMNINTKAHQEEVTKSVLAKYKDTWTNEAIAKYQDAIVTEVKEDKLDSYTSEAQDALSSTITSISNKATDKVTDIITETYVKPAYEYAIDQVMAAYPEDVDESKYGAAMVAINPDNQADDQYTDNNEAIPDEYVTALTEYLKDDIMSWKNGKAINTLADYIDSDERAEFRHERAYDAVSMLIGSNITSEDSKQEILDKLADYSVDEEKYDSFGFDYEKCKTLAYEATSSYQNQVDYEIGRISNSIKENEAAYANRIQEIKDDAYSATSGSFLDSLPEDVTDGLEELGTMDLYGLIVGSIFFKMAGLLLPIIYIIMVSNNLIASQVDTGSMAYVLSTSTRRKEVTFTQGLYLIGSTFLMFVFTTITSCVCFSLIDVNTDLTYEKLLLINLGAFVTMLAISGINFFTSCIFDRSKRAMAIGGGVSIFFLVATMLGLFGSPVIPSVVRITALNNFNYASIISLFDVVSILEGTDVWMYKMVILLVIGAVGYLVGSMIFKKKDLPL